MIVRIIFREIISVGGIFPRRLAFSSLRILRVNTRARAFGFTGPNEFWWIFYDYALMFLSSTFLVQLIAALSTEKLFTVETLCCAFLLFTFFAYSNSFMRQGKLIFILLFWWVKMLDVIALRAQKNLAIDTSYVHFAIFAEFTCKIHS